MKIILKLPITLLSLSLLTACHIDASFFGPKELASLAPPDPGPVSPAPLIPPPSGGGTSILDVKSGESYGVTLDQANRTITVNDVAGGRQSSFSLTEDGVGSTGLACSQTPAVGSFFIHNNIITWDPGFQPTATPAEVTFQCTTDGGAVDVVLKSKPASVRVVSSGWAQTAIGAGMASSRFSLSGDGKFMAWAANGGTSSGMVQILGRDFNASLRSTVSLNAVSQLGNNHHGTPQVSSDGGLVVFTSSATNYVAGAGSSTAVLDQVFVKNRQTGVVMLVSSADGTGATQANLSSYDPDISGDGNYVVFTSSATNLVAASSGSQIYRKNLITGTIDLVSSTAGTGATRGNAGSSKARVSHDGRYVVFMSESTNLVAGSLGRQIFRKDMVLNTIVLVSSTDGTVANQGNQWSDSPDVSSDGNYVVFSTHSNNLVAGSTGTQVFRKDLSLNTIALVSTLDGSVANRGASASTSPRISSDGNIVVFESPSANLASGLPAFRQIYARNMTANTLTLVSSPDGSGALAANSSTGFPEISGNGRYVGFLSAADNLVTGAASSYFEKIYVKDLQTGALSVGDFPESSVAARSDKGVSQTRMSPSGRYVVFLSDAKNLVSGMEGTQYQVFFKDTQTGAVALVSSQDGTGANRGNASSSSPDVSADGRYVVFASNSTNLISGTTSRQIFRKDLQTGTIALVSSTDGTVANRGNSSSDSPRISADGRYVAFTSWSTNLKAGLSGSAQQILVKDMVSQSLYIASSPDGVAEADSDSDYPSIAVSGSDVYVSFLSWSTSLKPGVSGSGQVYRKNITTQVLDLVSSTNGTVANAGNTDSDLPAMSSSGRYIVFISWATNFMAGLNGNGQVWHKDMVTGTLTLASSTDGTSANQTDDDIWSPPAVSDNGRYVAFTAVSANLYPADTSTFGNVFRKDLTTGAIELASSRSSAVPSIFENKDEYWTQISSDGRYVLFESNDSSLVDGIFFYQQQAFVRDMNLP